MATRAARDFLNPESLQICAKKFLGSTSEDPYFLPLSVNADWWKEARVRNLCILAGSFETFLDDILALAGKMKVE